MKKSESELAKLERLERLIAGDPLSQSEIAHELKINPTKLSRIKKGHCKASQKTDYRIMERYHIDKNYNPISPPPVPKVAEQAQPYHAHPDAEEKGRIVGKLAPELISCLYEYLMKQGREGHISVDPGGAIKKSGV